MDSKKLSMRLRQPGHDQTFLESERNFVDALRLILDENHYEVESQPKELRKLFAGIEGESDLGIQPEALIRSRETGRAMYFEVKKQGPQGNAEERAFKHHTVQFYKTLKLFTGVEYHAYCTVFCESLAVLPRYTTKFRYLIEPGHYFLWKDYDIELLEAFITHQICERFLDKVGPEVETDQ